MSDYQSTTILLVLEAHSPVFDFDHVLHERRLDVDERDLLKHAAIDCLFILAQVVLHELRKERLQTVRLGCVVRVWGVRDGQNDVVGCAFLTDVQESPHCEEHGVGGDIV